MKLAIIFNTDKLNGKLTKFFTQPSLFVERCSFFALSYQPICNYLAHSLRHYLYGLLIGHLEPRPYPQGSIQMNSSIAHKLLFPYRHNICSSKLSDCGIAFSLRTKFYKFLIFFRLLNAHVSKLLILILRHGYLLSQYHIFRKIFDHQTLAMRLDQKLLRHSRINIPITTEGRLSCKFFGGLRELQSVIQTFGRSNHLQVLAVNIHSFLKTLIYLLDMRSLSRKRTLLTILVPCIQNQLRNLQLGAKRSLSHIFSQYDLQDLTYKHTIAGRKLCQ